MLIVLIFLGISRAIPQKTSTPLEAARARSAPMPLTGPTKANPTVQIGDTIIPVELAKTPAEQERGLSYRISLDNNRGMLFVFEKPGLYKFWMPYMNFPLDMIWVDQDKRIVSISENVPPLSDLLKPIYYQPAQPAVYILEVNANFSKEHNIKVGDQLIFKNIDK